MEIDADYTQNTCFLPWVMSHKAGETRSMVPSPQPPDRKGRREVDVGASVLAGAAVAEERLAQAREDARRMVAAVADGSMMDRQQVRGERRGRVGKGG